MKHMIHEVVNVFDVVDQMGIPNHTTHHPESTLPRRSTETRGRFCHYNIDLVLSEGAFAGEQQLRLQFAHQTVVGQSVKEAQNRDRSLVGR